MSYLNEVHREDETEGLHRRSFVRNSELLDSIAVQLHAGLACPKTARQDGGRGGMVGATVGSACKYCLHLKIYTFQRHSITHEFCEEAAGPRVERCHQFWRQRVAQWPRTYG